MGRVAGTTFICLCLRCNYKWDTWQLVGIPRSCPSCGSCRWDVPEESIERRHIEINRLRTILDDTDDQNPQ